jgi:hypothetical protein
MGIALSRRPVQLLLVLLGVLLASALILPRLPHPVAGAATIDQCHGGWPVLVFEGEGWRNALPGDVRASAPRQIPVARWPSGLRFDEAEGVVIDARGDMAFRDGDRVTIRGSVIEVHGDPSPCFYTLGVEVDEIARA